MNKQREQKIFLNMSQNDGKISGSEEPMVMWLSDSARVRVSAVRLPGGVRSEHRHPR